jgi:hypothetical protein
MYPKRYICRYRPSAYDDEVSKDLDETPDISPLIMYNTLGTYALAKAPCLICRKYCVCYRYLVHANVMTRQENIQIVLASFFSITVSLRLPRVERSRNWWELRCSARLTSPNPVHRHKTD